MAGKPRNDEEVESFLDKIPMTFRDYPGEVEPSEPVQVTSVLIPQEPTEAVKPAKKEN